MEAIRTEALTKRYGDKTAVDSLQLNVAEGEIFALLGVNGAGKTTTIRMLCGLSAPTSGDAFIYGHSVRSRMEEVKRLGGISPQDTSVAENLTVAENLMFMAGICRRMTKAQARGKADEMMDLFGLEEVRNSRAKTLSGGWKRKLSIAMAMAGDPKILYLDEPTLGLDVLARRSLWSLIGKIREGKTIVLTTHYMEEAEALADRIAIMTEGKIAALGTLAELKRETGQDRLEEIFVQVAQERRP